MTHDHIHELINRQLDGALNRAETAQLNAHLAECAECARYATDMHTLDARLAESLPARWAEEPIPQAGLTAEGLPNRQPARRPEPTLGGNALALGGVLAAVAMLVVAVGLGLLLRGGPNQFGTADSSPPLGPVEATPTPAPVTTTAQARVTPTEIRGGPSLEWAVIAEVEEGEILTITGRTPQGDWMRIRWGQGNGWVATSQLIFTGDVTVIQEVEPPLVPATGGPLPTPTVFPGTPLPAITLEGVTQADPTLLYRQPLPDGETVIEFGPGEPVTIVGRTEDAAWVLVDEGGWVAADDLSIQGDVMTLGVIRSHTDLEPIPEAADGATVQATIISDPTNVRTFPSVDADLVAELGAGTEVTITGRLLALEWVRVRWEGGTGWVFLPLLSVDGDIETVAIVEAPDLPTTVVPTPTPHTCFVTAPGEGTFDPYVYEQPYTSAGIIGQAATGEQLAAVGQVNLSGEDWFEVVLTGRTGWLKVAGWQVNGCVGLPVVTPPPAFAGGTPTPTPAPPSEGTPQVSRPASDAITHRFTVNATSGYAATHILNYDSAVGTHLIEVYVAEPPGAMNTWRLNVRFVCQNDQFLWQDWTTGAQASCGTPGQFDKSASLGNAFYFVASIPSGTLTYTLELSISP